MARRYRVALVGANLGWHGCVRPSCRHCVDQGRRLPKRRVVLVGANLGWHGCNRSARRLFGVTLKRAERACHFVAESLGAPITRTGRIMEGQGVHAEGHGPSGDEHFA